MALSEPSNCSRCRGITGWRFAQPRLSCQRSSFVPEGETARCCSTAASSCSPPGTSSGRPAITAATGHSWSSMAAAGLACALRSSWGSGPGCGEGGRGVCCCRRPAAEAGSGHRRPVHGQLALEAAKGCCSPRSWAWQSSQHESPGAAAKGVKAEHVPCPLGRLCCSGSCRADERRVCRNQGTREQPSWGTCRRSAGDCSEALFQGRGCISGAATCCHRVAAQGWMRQWRCSWLCQLWHGCCKAASYPHRQQRAGSSGVIPGRPAVVAAGAGTVAACPVATATEELSFLRGHSQRRRGGRLVAARVSWHVEMPCFHFNWLKTRCVLCCMSRTC